ncbi:MAG: hypothetical protein HZB50_05265 [Chloroflexi bacterium]|nr:hypothetical protein [Chloroflexota bacterium]
MNSSDIIAIIAIVTSAILSIAVALIGYFTNKANIRARRSEIALEKRLEAFREIVEKCGVLKRLGSRYSVLSSDIEKVNSYEKSLATAIEEFYKVYQQQRVYLPPSIEKMVTAYGSFSFNFIANQEHTLESAKKWFEDIRSREDTLVAEIQKYIDFM